MAGTNGPRAKYGEMAVMVKVSILDLMICNCGSCGIELAGNSKANLLLLSRLVKTITHESLPQPVCRRINDRPFCRQCLIDAQVDVSGE